MSDSADTARERLRSRGQGKNAQTVLRSKGFLAASQRAKEQALHDHIVEAAKKAALNHAQALPYTGIKEVDAALRKRAFPAAIHKPGLYERLANKYSEHATEGFSHLPVGKTAKKFLQQASDAAVYLPSGLVASAKHPEQAFTAFNKSLNETGHGLFTHPLRQFQKDPFGTTTVGLGAAGAVAGTAGRASNALRAFSEASDAARLATTTSPLREAARAAARRPGGGFRTIYNKEGEATDAANFDSPLGRPIAAVTDRALGLNKPGPAFIPGLDRLRSAKFKSEAAQNARAEESIMPQRPIDPADRNKAQRVMRLVNRLQRYGMLYARPGGYIMGNIPGQVGLSAVQQGLRLPRNLAQAAKLRNTMVTGRGLNAVGKGSLALGKEDKESFLGLSGAGRVASSYPDQGPGALAKIEGGFGKWDEATGRFLGKILDDPYRTASLVHELHRQGVPAADIAKTIQEARGRLQRRDINEGAQRSYGTRGQAELQKVVRASRRGNRAMIDYGRLGKTERGWLRDFFFLYPWVKGSIQYTGRFPFEHPIQTAVGTQLSKFGAQNTGLPTNQPSITKGSFKVGDRNVPGLGKVPVVINPRYAGIFTQPVDTLKSLGALAPSITGIHASKYTDPGDSALPVISAAGQAWGDDGFSLSNFLSNVARTVPLNTLYKGIKDPNALNPTQVLYPRTAKDALKNFSFGSLAPKPQNPVKAKQIYRTETRTGQSKSRQQALSEQWLRSDILQKLQLTHPNMKHNGDFVIKAASDLRRHAQTRADVLKQYPQMHDTLHRGKLSHKGEFVAAVWAILPDTDAGRLRAKTFADKVAKIPDAALADEKTPSIESVSDLRKLIKALNTATSDLPYANGGAKIAVPK